MLNNKRFNVVKYLLNLEVFLFVCCILLGVVIYFNKE